MRATRLCAARACSLQVSDAEDGVSEKEWGQEDEAELVVSKRSGSYVSNERGRRYVDFFRGLRRLLE